MKNQIDQSTPFLAFYDLLRIRGIYSTEEKREKLRRGFRRAMALATVLVGLLLPQGARADWNQLPIPANASERTWAEDATSITLSHTKRDWNSFSIGSDHTVKFDGSGTAINLVRGTGASNIRGHLIGDNVWIINPNGISFAGAQEVDVNGLLAAALSTSADIGSGSVRFSLDQVGSGSVDFGGKAGHKYTVGIGPSVTAPSSALVVETSGMTGGGTITVAPSGGKITFNGVKVESGTVRGGEISFSDDSEVAGGTVTASTAVDVVDDDGGTATASAEIKGTLKQSGGSVSAAKIEVLTQTASGAVATTKEVTGNATVVGTLNGDSGLTVGSLESSGTVAANGVLAIGGDATVSGNVTATKIDASGKAFTQDGAGTITVSGGDGIVAATITQTSAAGTINASKLNGAVTQNGGTISGTTANGSVQITGALDQNAGAISLGTGTLTLGANSTAAGTVSAAKIDASEKTFTQDGAGAITVSGGEGIVAATIEQTSAAGTINASKLDGAVTQNGGTISGTTANGSVQITGALDQNAGAISLGTGTLTLGANSTAAGTVTAAKIDASEKTFTQDGAGTITVSGEGGIVAATIEQTSAAGTINASKLVGSVTQNGGTISGNGENLTLTKTITTQSGVIDVSDHTLTLAGGDTLSGTVSAGNIEISGTTKTLTQTGANSEITVSGGSFLADGDAFTQNSGTLTLSNAGGNEVKASVVQEEGGTIKSENGALTFATAVTKNAGTIGDSGQNVTFNGDVTQADSGKIVGDTVTAKKNIVQTADSGIVAEGLYLNAESTSQEYELTGGGNNVARLYGSTAKSIKIDNGTHDLTIGTEKDGNHYGINTTEGLTIKKAGAVADAGSGVVESKITVESAASVTLRNSTKFEVAGISSEGDVTIDTGTSSFGPPLTSLTVSGAISSTQGNVGLKSDSITQNGAISGANVTLDQTDAAGTLAVGKDITATGDILVRSANAVHVGAALAAGNNIVVKGESATIAGTDADHAANLAAKAVGVEATAGNVEVANANFVASDGVALKASGDLAIGDNVSMKKTAASATKDGSLVVYADGSIDSAKLLGADRPADNLTIAKGSLAFSTDSANPTEIGLNRFAYKTDQTEDAFITFSGAEIGIESAGNVNVAATRAEGVTIVSGSSGLGGSGAKVEAADVFSSTKADVNIGNPSDTGNLAAGLVASGDGKTVTLAPAGSVTVAKGAKISANGDLALSTEDGKAFTIEAGDENTDAGTVESTAGSVSIEAGGPLTVSGTVQANATGKDVNLKTTGNSDIYVYGTATAANTLDIDSGSTATRPISIAESGTAQAKTIVLHDDSGLGGNVTAEKIDATGKSILTGSNAKTITVTGADGIVASAIHQNGGTIKASKIDATVNQQGTGAKITGVADNGNVEITKLNQQPVGGGTVDVGTGTLTLRDDSVAAHTINAGSIVVQAADNTLKTLTQSGTGTITATGADGIKASEVVQSSTGTIKADKIDAALTQSGAATARANADDGTIEVVGKLTQSAEGATLGYAGQNDSGDDVVQNVTLKGGATQENDRFGKVLADTLTLDGADNEYSLNSLEGNAVSTIAGSAKSVGINNGTTDLTLQVNVGTAEDHTVSVLKAGDVTLDGVTAKSIFVAKAGDVTDTENQGATTIQLGVNDPEIGSTVGTVTLTKGTGALAIEGINATGDVGIQNASITQSGAISGANVTLHSTTTDNPDTTDVIEGALVVGKNITATEGDILVHSASAVEVGAASLTAENGSIVVKGTSATIAGTDADNTANLTAKEIGVEATKVATDTDPTPATMTLGNAAFVATGTGDGMDGVVLKSSGDMTIGADVAAGKTAAANKDADVTIKAEGTLNMTSDNQPAIGDHLRVAAGSLGEVNLTDGTGTVDYNSFVYTEKTDGTDLNFKFTGTTLSIKNLMTDDDGNVTGGGSVKVTTDGQKLDIVKSSATGNDDVKVEALDVTAASADTKESVEIAGSDPAGSDGIVAKGDITVDGSGATIDNPGAITVQGTVSSAEGAVSIKNAGAVVVSEEAVVQAGGGAVGLESGDAVTVAGTVRDFIPAAEEGADPTTASGGVTLGTTGTGDAAKDITIAGTVTSKGATTITSAKDAVLSGTVSSDGKLSVTAANDVKLSGAVSTMDDLVLTATAGDIAQTDGSVTANSSGKNTEITAAAGSISLAVTDDEGKAANNFTTISKAVAKNTIAISDKDALTIAGAAGSANGATATEGNISITAGEALTVTAAVNAGGDATLTGTGATVGGKVTAAQNATIDAKTGAAAVNAAVTATSGKVDISGGKVTTAAEAAVNAGTDAKLTASTGAVTTGSTVDAGNDATLTGTGATVGGKVTAAKNATIDAKTGAAAVNAAVTATSGKAEISGGTVTTDANAAVKAGTDATLTASSGAVTTGSTVEAGNDATITGTGATVGGAVTAAKNATINAKTGAAAVNAAVTATSGDATISGASVNATDLVKAENGLVSMTANGTGNNEGTVTTAAVSGQNVALEATAGVTEGGAVNAKDVNGVLGDKFVHTTGGDIAINSDFSAKNAVYKADNGAITIGDKISGVTVGLGLEGNSLTVDGTKISGVNTLVVNSKEGNITITGKPNGVEKFAIAAAGNVTVGGSGDFAFTDGKVVVSVPAGKAEDDRTVNVTGLQAGNDLTVNITGTLTTPAATAGGNVDIDATTANVGTATAGGAVTVDATTATVGNATANGGIAAVRTTTGDATVGNLSGTSAEVSSQNGNVVLTGTATARTGDANVTAANGTVTGGGNVNAAGAATVSTADNGGVVQIGNVTAGGQATVNGTTIGAGNIAGGTGTEVTARTGDVNAGNVGNGGATTVTAAGNATAGGITGGTVEVAAGGNVTAPNITGAGGTTVTAGGQVTATGNLGQGGLTTVTAGGLDAGTLASGGDTQLDIGGAANANQLAVGGNLGGQTGSFTTGGGQAGSIGQGGAFDAGTLQLDGDLAAGVVNIQALNGITGGGLLASTDLSLQGGDIQGQNGGNFRISSGTIRSVAGGNISLQEESTKQVTLAGPISASGSLLFRTQNGAAVVNGGDGSVASGPNGSMRLELSGPFGSLENPITIDLNGGNDLTITSAGRQLPLMLHVILKNAGELLFPDYSLYPIGFVILNNQIIGANPADLRQINRALAFTVNTPELKSKQGVFGDPAFIHTKMAVSEARSMGNMDMLALGAVDFRQTWRNLVRQASRLQREWKPAVYINRAPLKDKIQAVRSEMETQPEVQPLHGAGESTAAE